MQELISDFWVWPAILLAFCMGAIVTRWLLKHKSSSTVNQEYFKGLNYVLNEEPDKAIEVFIKALEVDSETVELHLALGGLFRRKGQVDRATRIHQNLIARPSLTEQQRLQAIYELAQDYYKAGLFDRAENLFIELKPSITYRSQAIEGLCSIYQLEKDWVNAIDVTRQHKRSDRAQYSRRIAHYWCELATEAISANKFEEARRYLRSALNEDRAAARVILLRGELNFQQHNYTKALSIWHGLAASHPSLAELTVGKMIQSYQHTDNVKGLKDYLLKLATIPKDGDSFTIWLNALTQLVGETAAIEQIFMQLKTQGLSSPVANYLFESIDGLNEGTPTLSINQQKEMLKDLLYSAKISNIEYTCLVCGFDAKAMHWHCPNCGTWDSFN